MSAKATREAAFVGFGAGGSSLGGAVDEWRYKVGVDGEPAAGVTLQIIDVASGDILWSGGVGTQGWSFVSSRRAFGWGQHVAVRASVRVDISGRVYSDTFSWLFDVAERPPSPRWTGAPALSPALDEHPVVVALRQIASATLLTRGASPPVVTVLADLALHSEVGQLLKPLLRDSGPDLFAEDTPSDADLRSFVSRADPFWRTALALMAPPEEVEALQRAWGSDHTVEQAGALAVLLCHSWWRHGD